MGIEQFPEIESFQKLPRRVIVKGASSRYDSKEGTELRGIVINNLGHTIRDVSVNLVVFDEKETPQFSTSTTPEPSILHQGSIGSFVFRITDHPAEIKNYYLYTSWKYDDREH